MTARHIKVMAQSSLDRQELDAMIAGLSRLLPGFLVRWVPLGKQTDSGEPDTLLALMSEARLEPGVVRGRELPGGHHFAIFDEAHEIFLVASHQPEEGSQETCPVPPLIARLFELELQRLQDARTSRRLATRARQLERQVEVLGLQHENSIESNYRYHDELRRARDNYARQLERDVERRTAELRRTNRELEKALEVKRQFLASVSHELRTPMNAVIGMTDLLLHTSLDEEQHEYATHVRSSGEALLELINDILDLSKIDAGKVELEPTEFGLRDLVAEVMKILATHELNEDLELSWFVEPEVPDRVFGDLGRVRQILFNLGSNAIKFTRSGEVRVSVELEPSDPRLMRFTVADTGIGIPEDKHRMIFEAFVQADGSTTREYGGTGLGLAICAQLVELMGGRIWVESEPGHGSEFHAAIRLDPVASLGDGASPSPFEPLRGLRAVIVSPHALNRRFLTDALSRWEITHRVADSLETALEWLKSEPWDVAIFESRLQDRDGRRVVERLNEVPGPTRVILLGRPAERRALEDEPTLAGVLHLSKPLTQSEVMTALLQARAGNGSRAPAARRAPRSPTLGRSLRILLAEDNLVNQKLAIRLLERDGHDVVLAENGVEVLTILEDDAAFDAILMDVQMPLLDGMDATREIRRREETAASPPQYIIALTANAMEGDRERCLEAGMDDYLAKPIVASGLIDALGRIPPRSAPDHSPGETMSDPSYPTPAFDLEAALNLVEGDEDLLREIIGLFLDTAPDQLRQVEQAIAAEDASALQRAAHTLKGQAGQLAAGPTAQAAFRIEQMGRNGSLDGAKDALEHLRAQLEGLTAELETFCHGPSTPPPPKNRPPIG